MATVVTRLGPAKHSKRVAYKDFVTADREPGYEYEIIDGRLAVPTIREYWVLDGRPDPDHPTMLVHRRHGQRWRIIEVGFGETYTTKLFPGFKLVLDPRR